MLSKEERRFLRYWEDQREGGKWKFLALYGIAWTLMLLTFLFIFLIVLTEVLKNRYAGVLLIGGSLLFSFLLSLLTWNRGERKFKRIIRREMGSGNPDGAHLPEEPGL